MDNDESRKGVAAQIYATLCVNLLSVRLVRGNYVNLMGCNETAGYIG